MSVFIQLTTVPDNFCPFYWFVCVFILHNVQQQWKGLDMLQENELCTADLVHERNFCAIVSFPPKWQVALTFCQTALCLHHHFELQGSKMASFRIDANWEEPSSGELMETCEIWMLKHQASSGHISVACARLGRRVDCNMEFPLQNNGWRCTSVWQRRLLSVGRRRRDSRRTAGVWEKCRSSYVNNAHFVCHPCMQLGLMMGLCVWKGLPNRSPPSFRQRERCF